MPLVAFRPLRHRDFALLWSASLVSNIGTWMETVAVGSLIARDTGRAAAVGAAAAAAFLPSALLSPIGGLISDRVHRKRFLLLTLGFDTALAVVLAVLIANGHRSPALLSTILFLEGCSGALAMPNRQSLMPELVPRDELVAAVSLGSTAWNGGRVVGPALAGILISAAGPTWAVVANAVSFAVMLVAATFIRLPERLPARDGDTIRQRLAAGADAIRTRADCRLGVILIVAIASTAAPFIGLIPIVARQVFGGGAGTTALFVTAQGIGAIAGAIVAPTLADRHGRERMIAGFMLGLPPSLVLYALSPTSAIASLALAVVGACYMGVFAGAQALVQLGAPNHLKARVISLFSVALGMAYTVSVSVNGVLADKFGLRQVHLLQAALTAAAVLLLAMRLPGWWRGDQVGSRVGEQLDGRTSTT